MSDFALRLRELIEQRGFSYRQLATMVHYSKSYVHELAAGSKVPTTQVAEALDRALGADGELAGLVKPTLSDDEIEAYELARRVAASDVSDETLEQLELAFDELATGYATIRPADLLPRVRRHLAYVGTLLDGKATLSQRRRLIVTGGWLSLLAATLHIDLRNRSAATARLCAAARLAEHVEHAEIRAWCLETRAWDRLTDGDFAAAVDLSQQAQTIAPHGSSAHIQATAQEGRAWARMHQVRRTRQALSKVTRLTSSLAMPDRPEHHYRYDPGKALAYTATTLAWAGDPAAEEYTRSVIADLESAPGGIARPRRVASARLDLGLALVAVGRPDEAVAEAIAAITSGRIVPSNWWRATEVLSGVKSAGIPELRDLRDAYETFRPVR